MQRAMLTSLLFLACGTWSRAALARGEGADPVPPAGGDAKPAGDAAAAPATHQPATPVTPDAAPPDSLPASPPAPSVTIKQGMLFIQVNLEASVDSTLVNMAGSNLNRPFKPFSIAPDISYGLTPDLTISLITSTTATNGFRGAQGYGLCVSQTDAAGANCLNDANKRVFRDVGLEGVYSLVKGPFAVGANAGVLARDLSEMVVDAKVGIKSKYTINKRFYALFNPSVWIGLTKRDDVSVSGRGAAIGGSGNDYLWLPVSLWAKATPDLLFGFGTGFKAPLDGPDTKATVTINGTAMPGTTVNLFKPGEQWTVPVGVIAQYTINPHIAIGASFVFGKLFGASGVAGIASPDTSHTVQLPTGADYRTIHLWLNYSM